MHIQPNPKVNKLTGLPAKALAQAGKGDCAIRLGPSLKNVRSRSRQNFAIELNRNLWLILLPFRPQISVNRNTVRVNTYYPFVSKKSLCAIISKNIKHILS